MKGHKFLKVTGILMIIAAVFSIIAGVLASVDWVYWRQDSVRNPV